MSSVPPTIPLQQLVETIDEVSTIPLQIEKILEAARNPATSAHDLMQLIQADPATAARVMRCANSAAFAPRRRFENLRHAIGHLGFLRVRNLVVGSVVCRYFQKPMKEGPYDRRGLWKHMASVAVTSRLVAEYFHLPNPDEVFLAGLLHDLGIALEDQHLHAAFAYMMREYPAQQPLTLVEKKFLGFDHCELGAAVGRRWNLPESVIDTMQFHHSLRYTGPHARTVAAVELANVMCSMRGIRAVDVPLTRLSPSVLEHLNLRDGTASRLVESLAKGLENHQDLVDLLTAA